MTDINRRKAEQIIYDTMDALDPSKKNSDYYRLLFSRMDDKEFRKFASNKFPYRFQPRLFKIEPKMSDINNAAKILGIPLMEKINMPYLYEDKNGNPVKSKEALVIYSHQKKMKQFISKKNSMSIDIDARDMKTGLLVSKDKNAQASDREMESLLVMGLDNTVKELSRPRADAMASKSVMYNTINTTGTVSLKDLPFDNDEVLAKNLLNVYMIGSMLNTNLINKDNYLPLALKNKERKVTREV